MAHLARNVASEAKIKCPKCEKSEKGRKLKSHIKNEHKLLCLYTCIFPISEGKICNFACGKWMSCFIHHQEKRHNISFADKSEHEFTSDNYFAFCFKPVGKDEHTPACDVERKSFKTESQARVNLKQSQERAEAKRIRQAATAAKKAAAAAEKTAAAAAARKIKAESLAAAKAAAGKRKAGCSAAKRPAKRAKKSNVKEETHTTKALVLARSAPSGNVGFPGKADEPTNALEFVGGDSQKDEEPKKPENDDYDEVTEAFFRHCYADQEISDSESDDDEDTKFIIPKKVDDEVLLYKAGCGRFSPDVRDLCKAAVAEMEWKYGNTDPQGWKTYMRKLSGFWHPDKNADEDSAKATVVFQCIQNERKKLEGNLH